MPRIWIGACLALLCTACAGLEKGPGAGPDATDGAEFDPALAARYGADDYGMRGYVLVILKSGPTPVPAGPERDAMFRGHFANMERLSQEGKLVLAGPLDGVDGWRGLFVLAVQDIEEARALASTDPVLRQGEMVAEYHTFYGSAALVGVRDAHARVAKLEM